MALVDDGNHIMTDVLQIVMLVATGVDHHDHRIEIVRN